MSARDIILLSLGVFLFLIYYNLLNHVVVKSPERRVVLVTGAAGLVGSHLSEELLKRNRIVYGLDNLSTGQQHNLDWLRSYGDFHFINRDVTDTWPEDGFSGLDEIYHLASPASPKAYYRDPMGRFNILIIITPRDCLIVGTYRANTVGTENMIELARRHFVCYLPLLQRYTGIP